MDLQLAGKPVVVTGGADAAGAAISLSLAREGAVPVILDRAAPPPALMAELQRRAPRTLALQLDLVDEAACVAAVRRVLATVGQVHGLVNNAGGNDTVPLESPTDAWRGSLERNLVQCMVLARELLPSLRQTRGAIVNISSKTAVTGQGRTSGYVAAKGALLGLTREWAAALRGDGIRVNAVIPAEVWTASYERYLSTFDDPAAQRAEVERRIPLGQRMTTAEEIADTVVFHLSPRAGHTTGQWLFVDGGYTHLDRAL